MEAPAPTLPDDRPVKNPWLVLGSLILGFFMALLDITIVNIAIPNIQASLQTDLPTVSWVLNAYNLVFAVLLVTMGRLADQFGRKRLFMIGMVLFSAGSFLCAIAPTIEWLIAFRAFQAVGAAALNPVSLAIITAVFPTDRRGAAIGLWGALGALAAAAGPVLGGFLLENYDWRWIFLINLPFCALGLLLTARNVPESRDPAGAHRFDLPGLGLLTVGMFCLTLAIIQGDEWGWTSAPILGLFLAAAAALGLFAVVETRQAQPILDLRLFRLRSFTAANTTMFLLSMAVQGALLILVIYFITIQRYDPLDAAYAIIPIALAAFVVAAGMSMASRRISPRAPALTGMALTGVGLGLLGTLGSTVSYADTAWREVIIGAGMGLCFTALPNAVLVEVPQAKLGVGSGTFNTFRQLGFVLGVAVLISMFNSRLEDHLALARAEAVAVVQAETSLPITVRALIAAGVQRYDPQAGSGPANLAELADRIPNGQALKPALAVLTARLTGIFERQALEAFRVTWFASAFIALLGLIPALLAQATRQRAPAPDARRPEVVPVH
jgi:EmrB/QacA subfamily drug resistance transporter